MANHLMPLHLEPHQNWQTNISAVRVSPLNIRQGLLSSRVLRTVSRRKRCKRYSLYVDVTSHYVLSNLAFRPYLPRRLAESESRWKVKLYFTVSWCHLTTAYVVSCNPLVLQKLTGVRCCFDNKVDISGFVRLQFYGECCLLKISFVC